MEFIKPGININFVGVRRYAYAVSLITIALTIVVLIAHGGLYYGVDFAGGVLIQVKFQKPITPSAIREGLVEVKMTQASIQGFGASENNEFLIRVPEEGQELKGLSQQVQASLERKFGSGSVEIRRVEMVGPKVGEDLRSKALFAIFYTVLFILIYISGRFELKWGKSIIVAGVLLVALLAATLIGTGIPYMIMIALATTIVVMFFFQLKYALGAIVALVHDLIVTVGFLTFFSREIDLTVVAALLTILGYSLNDTIIVYDRIRENLRKTRKEPFELIINRSINETLSRTTLTSGLTMLAVLSLLILGGPVIFDFALTMTIGIITGTFSSIYVASPILLIWPGSPFEAQKNLKPLPKTAIKKKRPAGA